MQSISNPLYHLTQAGWTIRLKQRPYSTTLTKNGGRLIIYWELLQWESLMAVITDEDLKILESYGITKK